MSAERENNRVYADGSECGSNDLAIRGGRFAADQAEEFLRAWSLPREGLNCGLWEWADRIDFTDGAAPGDLDLLERGQVFGTHGTLTLRRDADAFRWHFVGRPDVAVPENCPGADYWRHHPEATFCCREVKLLLWVVSAQGVENRVGKARLRYPVAGRLVRVVARQFTAAGVEAFVWWLGLEEQTA